MGKAKYQPIYDVTTSIFFSFFFFGIPLGLSAEDDARLKYVDPCLRTVYTVDSPKKNNKKSIDKYGQQ